MIGCQVTIAAFPSRHPNIDRCWQGTLAQLDIIAKRHCSVLEIKAFALSNADTSSINFTVRPHCVPNSWLPDR
jgi:hypothetical protein